MDEQSYDENFEVLAEYLADECGWDVLRIDEYLETCPWVVGNLPVPFIIVTYSG